MLSCVQRPTVPYRAVLVVFAAFCMASGSAAQSVPPKFKVIGFFSANYDVAHISFAHEANKWFPEMGRQYGFTYDSTKDWSKLNATFLSDYQVVLFLDNQPPSGQRAAFQQYMDKGGAWMGFHVCAFNTRSSDWDWYYNQLLGCGSFKTNTWGPTSAIFKVEDNTHASTLRLPSTFTSAVSEWYGWTTDLRTKPDINILCSIDPRSFPLGTDPNQSWYSGYYPVVWTNRKYRMVYANFGHNDIDYARNNADKSKTFGTEITNRLVIDALLWLGGSPTVAVDKPPRPDAGAGMPRMDIIYGDRGLTVSRPGLTDFGISILDLQGNTLAEGRTATGRYSIGHLRLAQGRYVVRSQSEAGNSMQTLIVP